MDIGGIPMLDQKTRCLLGLQKLVRAELADKQPEDTVDIGNGLTVALGELDQFVAEPLAQLQVAAQAIVDMFGGS